MTLPQSESSNVEVKGLVKYFGNDRAVDGISFKVPQGGFLTLLGPSGCGKTTTLMCIAGLHHFDAVLRDIANIERRAHAGTAILVHDVIPYHARGQAREEMSLMWTGDVWKAMVGLQRWRPDLSVTVIRTQPTGLALIQGFDPENDVLFAKHEEMVATLMPLPYDRGYREQEGIAEADASIDTVRALLRGPAA